MDLEPSGLDTYLTLSFQLHQEEPNYPQPTYLHLSSPHTTAFPSIFFRCITPPFLSERDIIQSEEMEWWERYIYLEEEAEVRRREEQRGEHKATHLPHIPEPVLWIERSRQPQTSSSWSHRLRLRLCSTPPHPPAPCFLATASWTGSDWISVHPPFGGEMAEMAVTIVAAADGTLRPCTGVSVRSAAVLGRWRPLAPAAPAKLRWGDWPFSSKKGDRPLAKIQFFPSPFGCTRLRAFVSISMFCYYGRMLQSC